jgi:peptidoglycan-N-acetylglucosamine deacetylase
MRLCSISVDLDEIPNYFAIHGLPPPQGRGATAVYDVALGRLERFASAHGLPLTLFAIGSDLTRSGSASGLRWMSKLGHEVANHTLDHLYDLTRRSRGQMTEQVSGGIEAIHRAAGVRPTGFRAPGYTVTDSLFDVLAECGVAYDSSVFPCPPYYLAKVAAMGLIRLRGRESRSVLDTPTVLTAPTRPYRVGRPYHRRGSGVLELPIQVTRYLRLPFFGTTLTLAGASRARWLTQLVIGEPFVNLELHGIDVLDASDGLEELRGHQVDVRVDHGSKLEALGAVVEMLRGAGYGFVRRDEAARVYAPRPGE